MTTRKILNFLDCRDPAGPCLVVDLEIVRKTYRALQRALPQTRIHYAVKANPAPEILELLAGLGASFDVASVAEARMVLEAGAPTCSISYGNTIKKERDIAQAHRLGVRQFAVDCPAEVEKIARSAPGSQVICRLLSDGAGAEWPLSRKFGCDPSVATGVMRLARQRGLDPCGLSFHVGSQQTDPRAWQRGLEQAAKVVHTLAGEGILIRCLNLGGGFPARYLSDVPGPGDYGREIQRALRTHFGNAIPDTVIEPGRGLVGNAGTIKSEVVLISTKSPDDPLQWVYLDIGKFGGLAETMGEAIRYPLKTRYGNTATVPYILAGPTCDSADVLYEQRPCRLPHNLQIGDDVLIEGTGAYTSTYASVGFNGFGPLEVHVV
ncbi:type III PLP-dependent enzyme [Labrenzia sp. OB1]|uniref:type III PLP-dependent enzyme n=1 Tax=Labrenzia sp. OB1 TaxID=1561204 RepID=UPI0007B23EF2|nr:type III PLP-dependent enzyme [Labrenzia sp. OB1]KZM50753.1 ornithine decarboxylase [Labrenzia sp. OB1]